MVEYRILCMPTVRSEYDARVLIEDSAREDTILLSADEGFEFIRAAIIYERRWFDESDSPYWV